MSIAFSLAHAQNTLNQDQPLTKIEELLLIRGTLIEKTFYDLGNVGCKNKEKLVFQIIEILDTQSGDKTYGLLISLESLSINISGYLDSESLVDFAGAFNSIIVRAAELAATPIGYKEVYYISDNDIKTGFYQQDGDKPGETLQTGFLFLNDWQRDARAYFGENRFVEIQSMLKAAIDKIDSLRGTK